MSLTREISGLFIFGILVVVVLLGAVIAIEMTGTMGIEDRYNQAVGLPVSGEESGEEPGFSLEGDLLFYVGILVLLIGVSLVMYRQYVLKA